MMYLTTRVSARKSADFYANEVGVRESYLNLRLPCIRIQREGAFWYVEKDLPDKFKQVCARGSSEDLKHIIGVHRSPRASFAWDCVWWRFPATSQAFLPGVAVDQSFQDYKHCGYGKHPHQKWHPRRACNLFSMPQWARIALAFVNGIAGERTQIKLHLTGGLVPKMADSDDHDHTL